MTEKKLIAVVGATGAQGGGLVRAILEDPTGNFAVRAITRDANSEKAKSLAALGAEVVTADLDDVESLKNAFAGAYGIFGITNFWEHFNPEKEIAQAKNIAEAAKSAGAQHVIWSTLEDTRKLVPLSDNRMPTLQEKYKVPHFDAKGEADHFFTDLGVPTTFLLTSFYWDNFIHFGAGPKRGPDGVVALTIPMGDKKLPGIDVTDIGRAALSVFKDPNQIGKYVGIAGEHLTGAEMAQAFTENLRRTGRLQRRAVRGVPRLRLPWCRRHGQHVPVQARLQQRIRRCPGHRSNQGPQSKAPHPEGLACGAQVGDFIRVA